MRIATAANRRAPRSLAALEDRILLVVRQPLTIYPALPTGEAAPRRSSGRGLATCFVPQTPCGADSLVARSRLGPKSSCVCKCVAEQALANLGAYLVGRHVIHRADGIDRGSGITLTTGRPGLRRFLVLGDCSRITSPARLR